LWLRIILRDIEKQISATFCPRFAFDFFSIKEDAQLVLIDMAYQMGVSGMFAFKKMIAAIYCNYYSLAADELLDSEYHRKLKELVDDPETETRSERNAELLRGCA
jgi:hypothetical protein